MAIGTRRVWPIVEKVREIPKKEKAALGAAFGENKFYGKIEWVRWRER
jgi:hypothetical protein